LQQIWNILYICDVTECNIADERKRLEECYDVFSLTDIKESEEREGLLELVKDSLGFAKVH